MRRKVMAATAMGWLILFAAGAACHVLSSGAPRDPNNTETWWDFQLSVYYMVMLPLALPILALVLAIEHWTLGPKTDPTADVRAHQ